MWVKWINCRVPNRGPGHFAAAQRGWTAIADQPGLVGQIGGWNPAGGRAYVLGLWADEDACARFMEERHDTVAEPASAGTWRVAEVATSPAVLGVPGEAADLRDGLTRGTLLRVADCHLHPGRAEHFLDAQRRVWNPAMASAGGMLAGTVARLEDDRYLVTTLWTGWSAHRRYARRDVAALRARADVTADVRALTGLTMHLQPEWQVLPG
ncbi:DUF4937 domain-containing protein [Kitasatospora sp. NPDC001660]